MQATYSEDDQNLIQTLINLQNAQGDMENLTATDSTTWTIDDVNLSLYRPEQLLALTNTNEALNGTE